MKNLVREIINARKARVVLKQCKIIKPDKALKLNLGCGCDIKKGWVNIDLVPNFALHNKSADEAETIVLNYDLRYGLLFSENSCNYIYSSHFLEHIELESGLKLLRDCYRVLNKGGILRLAMPNFYKGAEAYVHKNWSYFDLLEEINYIKDIIPGQRLSIDYFPDYQKGLHKAIYDEESIISILKHIGFRSVKPDKFKPEIDMDTELRKRYSFYVEAVK